MTKALHHFFCNKMGNAILCCQNLPLYEDTDKTIDPKILKRVTCLTADE